MPIRFLLILVLALPLPAPAATILVFGDSLSSGYGLQRGTDWVSLLEQRLREHKRDYKVVNASVSGETSLGGRNRIAPALKEHRPGIVILALGGNDGLRGQNPAAMRDNLAAIIEASRRAGAEVLLVGMRIPPNYGTAYAEKFHAVYGDLARRHKLPLVPFLLEGFAEDRGYFQADGIHPNARAQPLMLETVWAALRTLIK
jgi:acyl-CoA thioesterase-1